MMYPSNERVIAVVVGTFIASLTGALFIILLFRQRMMLPCVDRTLWVYIFCALQMLFGVTSCVLIVATRHLPGVDNPNLLIWLGLIDILSAQFTEVSVDMYCTFRNLTNT